MKTTTAGGIRMSNQEKRQAERRRFPRVMAPIFYRSPRIFSPKRKITNISLGGVRIYSDEPIEVGKRLEIEFFLPEDVSIIAIVRVVWIEKLPPDARAPYDVGLEFIDLPPHALKELESVLESAQ
jgi:hypothetical protein